MAELILMRHATAVPAAAGMSDFERPLSPQGAEDLHDLIRERYERRSLIITSNRAFNGWPEAFGDDA